VSETDAFRDAAFCTSRRAFLASAGAFVAWAHLPALLTPPAEILVRRRDPARRARRLGCRAAHR
jgi:hypothetical protein